MQRYAQSITVEENKLGRTRRRLFDFLPDNKKRAGHSNETPRLPISPCPFHYHPRKEMAKEGYYPSVLNL
jgi:hypothetical protein